MKPGDAPGPPPGPTGPAQNGAGQTGPGGWPGPAPQASPSAGGWYADPWGRFAFRYFDGSVWSGWVSDSAGRTFADPASGPGGPGGPPGPGHGPPARPRAPVASWVPLVLSLGVLVLLATLFVLPWVDADEGQFTDVRHGLISAADAGAEVDGWLVGYVEWGVWAITGLSVVTALFAVYGRRRMSTGARIALIAVASVLLVMPIMLVMLAGQALDQTDGRDEGGMPVAGGLVVAVVLIALFVGSTFVPAHVVTAIVAGAGVLWHLHALNELSDGDVDLELGAQLGWIGFVALAVAAVAGRRQRPRTT